MFEPDEPSEPTASELEHIYHRAPAGALALAGIATTVVFGLWLAFYVVVFLPRGLLE